MNRNYNKIYNADSSNMREIASASVQLVITSPPYNLNKEYELGESFHHWQSMMEQVLSECLRILQDGGRLCINVANTGRRPYVALTAELTKIALRLGFLERGEII